jgi:hypothetical protein
MHTKKFIAAVIGAFLLFGTNEASIINNDIKVATVHTKSANLQRPHFQTKPAVLVQPKPYIQTEPAMLVDPVQVSTKPALLVNTKPAVLVDQVQVNTKPAMLVDPVQVSTKPALLVNTKPAVLDLSKVPQKQKKPSAVNLDKR